MLNELRQQGLWQERPGDVAMVSDPQEALPQATVLINATSVGLDGQSVPLDPATLPDLRVFDLVYGLDGTPLVRAARARGLPALDGLWMLVYQAASAFALWTGRHPSEAIMYAAARTQLEERRTMQAQRQHEQLPGGG
jgi:shikimate dehydrogenase